MKTNDFNRVLLLVIAIILSFLVSSIEIGLDVEFRNKQGLVMFIFLCILFFTILNLIYNLYKLFNKIINTSRIINNLVLVVSSIFVLYLFYILNRVYSLDYSLPTSLKWELMNSMKSSVSLTYMVGSVLISIFIFVYVLQFFLRIRKLSMLKSIFFSFLYTPISLGVLFVVQLILRFISEFALTLIFGFAPW